MRKFSHKAFTLVELIVTIAILAILATIGFISLINYVSSAQDTVRIQDIGSIESVLEYSQLQSGRYPTPDSPREITYSGAVVWTQGIFGLGNQKITKGISKVPTDPEHGNYYSYSVDSSGKEFQIGGATENAFISSNIFNETYADTSGMVSYVKGNYNGMATKIKQADGNLLVLALPSIMSSDLQSTNLADILLYKRIAYDGETCLPASYNSTDLCTKILVNANPAIFEAYSGSVADLQKSQENRIAMIKKLQNAYLGSNTTLSERVELLKNITILPSGPNNEAITFANQTAEFTLDLDLMVEEVEPVDPYALSFASGNLYTSNWTSNSCPGEADVVYIEPGDEDQLKTLLPGTVYVLSSGTYTMDGQINMADCSTLIGVGSVEIESNAFLGALISVNGRSNIIVDNLSLNGFNGTPTKTLAGVELIAASSDSTLTNLSTYNFARGVTIEAGSNNIIVNNVKTFNNYEYGLYIFNSSNIIAENIISYNNNGTPGNNRGTGIYFNNSNNNHFSNVISYNNSYHGILIGDGSDYNTINNASVYNNESWGTYIYEGDYNVLSNMSHYENGQKELDIQSSTLANNNIINEGIAFAPVWNGILSTSTTTTYYGNMYTSAPTPDPDITRGTGHAILADGVTPVTTLTFDSTYAVVPSGTWDYTANGRQIRSFDGSETYSFGSNIASQIQPVRYNGTTLETYGSFDAGKKIGEW